MMIELSNDFHNAITKIRFPNDSSELFLTDAQARRIGNRLCGMDSACTCSGLLGIRGPQESFEVDGVWCHVETEPYYESGESGILISIVED